MNKFAIALAASLAFSSPACLPENAPEVVAKSGDVAGEVQERLANVRQFLADAEKIVGTVPEVAKEVADFDEAYKTKRYSDAIASAHRALVALEDAGYAVPGDVDKDLATAADLLRLLGK